MKTWVIAARLFLWFSLVTGLAYPALVTVIAQLAFRAEANGSLVRNGAGATIGSALIAQRFASDQYFWPRPSAVDYNAMNSGGSQLGPTSADLAVKIRGREAQGATGDLLYASGSGLDPHVSPESALAQVARVAKARGLDEAEVGAIVLRLTEKRQFGLLGEPRVNVLRLNLALDERN